MFLFTLLFPPLLMGLALLMQRVEEPLRDEQIADRVVEVLHARPVDDVEAMVRTQAQDSLQRYWRRQRRMSRRLTALRVAGRQ